MSSATSQPRLSVRRLLLVVVLLLGLCVVLLGVIANATRGYDTLVGRIGTLVGGVTALGALLALYDSLFPVSE